jgi:hypothetical protein
MKLTKHNVMFCCEGHSKDTHWDDILRGDNRTSWWHPQRACYCGTDIWTLCNLLQLWSKKQTICLHQCEIFRWVCIFWIMPLLCSATNGLRITKSHNFQREREREKERNSIEWCVGFFISQNKKTTTEHFHTRCQFINFKNRIIPVF